MRSIALLALFSTACFEYEMVPGPDEGVLPPMDAATPEDPDELQVSEDAEAEGQEPWDPATEEPWMDTDIPRTDPDDPWTGTPGTRVDPDDPWTDKPDPGMDPEEPLTATLQPWMSTNDPWTGTPEPGMDTDDPWLGTGDVWHPDMEWFDEPWNEPPQEWLDDEDVIYPDGPARMTGGGRVDREESHAFTIHCVETHHANNMSLSWEHGSFHLEGIYWATCLDDPGLNSQQPEIVFDTVVGMGWGRMDGQQQEVDVWFRLTDNGEPCESDHAWVVVDLGTHELEFRGHLESGNHQAHGPVK